MDSPKSQKSSKIEIPDDSQSPFDRQILGYEDDIDNLESGDKDIIQQTADLHKQVSGIFLQDNKNKMTPNHIFTQLRLNTEDFDKRDNLKLLDQLIIESNSQDQTELQKQQVDKIISEWSKTKKKSSIFQGASKKDADKKKEKSQRKSDQENEFPHQEITPSWILKHQGVEKVEQIIEQQFVKRMWQYDINQVDIGDHIGSNTDYEMIYSGNQVYYAVKRYDQIEERLELNLYAPSRVSDESSTNLTNYNSESVFPQNIKVSSSFVSFQQCGEYIYYFQIGEPAYNEMSIRETEITDVSQKDQSQAFQTPTKHKSGQSERLGLEKMASSSKQNLVKTSLQLIRYHIPSCYKEICHVYDAPDKYDDAGAQLTPMSVVFIKDQASVTGQTFQNWPSKVDGSNCQKFLDSLIVAVLYHESEEQNYYLSIRSLNPKKFSKEELFYSPKSFPVSSRLDIMIAKKASNPDLPCNQVVLIYVDNRGQYALRTESMLCITSGQGGRIGLYVSKLQNLKAFGGGNSNLSDYLHKIAQNTLSYPKNSVELVEENGNILKLQNQKSLSKVCPLINKLIEMDQLNQNKKSIKFKALFDLAQETLIITHVNRQFIFSKGYIQKTDKIDLLTHSQQLNQHGFIPPHVKAIFHDRDVTFDEGFVQLSYQFSNIARDQHKVYYINHYDAFNQANTNYFKMEDRDHQFALLQNPVISQGKKKGDATFFDPAHNHFNCPKEILQKYQIYFSEDKQKLAIQKGRLGDLDESPCVAVTESLIFREDDRNERALVVIDPVKKGIYVVVFDFKQQKIIEQVQLYLNQGDLNSVSLSSIRLTASSGIKFQNNNEFEQMFQVCMSIGDYQINLYELKMRWGSQWMGGVKVTIGVVGEKRLYLKESNILKFFGPFFKAGYEIHGSQIIFECDDKVRILNLPNETSYQYTNKFGRSGCQRHPKFWIGYIKYSDDILKASGIKQLEMMKVGDHVIDGLLKTTPFSIKSYFLKENWIEGSSFFENHEILNGNSPAIFSLEDHRYYESSLKNRLLNQQIDFGPFGSEKYDPLFQRSIHLSSFLEYTDEFFQQTQEKILEAMFKNDVDLNNPIYSVLVENIMLVFHSKQGQIPKGELDLSPLIFKSKVNNFTGEFSSQQKSLNDYSLAKSVYQVNLENISINESQTNMPMIIIDKQWTKATRFYCWFNILIYVFGYFYPLMKHINADSIQDDSGRAPITGLFVAMYFVLVAVNGLMKFNVRCIYILDILMFTTFYFYYLKRFSRSFSCQSFDQTLEITEVPETNPIPDANPIPEANPISEANPIPETNPEAQALFINLLSSNSCSFFDYYEEIEEDDMFNSLGFRALKSYLIIHCMIKLASLFRIIESFRIIIDSVYIASIGLLPIGLMIALATVVITQIDQLYMDNKSFQDLLTDLIQRWWTISPLFDSSQKSYLYISIYYFGEMVLPIIFVNMIIAVIFERYDYAVSKNNQLQYEARSAMNLEFFSLLQPKLFLEPLSKLDFSIEQKAHQLGNADVQGIAQSVKSYIHTENAYLRQTLKNLTDKIGQIDQKMNQGLGEQFPVFEKQLITKSNQMANDIKKLDGMVQKLVNQDKKEESKHEDARRSSIFGFMGGSTRKPNHQNPMKEAQDNDQLRNRNATPMRTGERESRFV